MSLFDLNGNPTPYLDVVAGGGAANVDAEFNRPAHWSDRQQWMFRPATGRFLRGRPGPAERPNGINPNSPASMYYPPYQYCDTDATACSTLAGSSWWTPATRATHLAPAQGRSLTAGSRPCG
jgi:hypothetical protein